MLAFSIVLLIHIIVQRLRGSGAFSRISGIKISCLGLSWRSWLGLRTSGHLLLSACLPPSKAVLSQFQAWTSGNPSKMTGDRLAAEASLMQEPESPRDSFEGLSGSFVSGETQSTSPSVFIWTLSLTAGISGILFGYESVTRNPVFGLNSHHVSVPA